MYYSVFNQICINFYEGELNTKMLEVTIELDETHLFTEKKHKTPLGLML